MPKYDYKCPNTHNKATYGRTYYTMEFQHSIHSNKVYSCPLCGAVLRRVPSKFAIAASMPAHYNSTIGRHVNNSRDFHDGLKQLSDTKSESTGIPHNFQPVDLRDKEALGVTDEGINRDV